MHERSPRLLVTTESRRGALDDENVTAPLFTARWPLEWVEVLLKNSAGSVRHVMFQESGPIGQGGLAAVQGGALNFEVNDVTAHRA